MVIGRQGGAQFQAAAVRVVDDLFKRLLYRAGEPRGKSQGVDVGGKIQEVGKIDPQGAGQEIHVAPVGGSLVR